MVDNIAVVDRGTSPLSSDHAAVKTSKPRLANSNIYAIDITQKFRDSTTRLFPGHLIKDEQFTLFESVGALEIGDPKMDSGLGDAEELEAGFDVNQSLELPEILWMMDELLCREVAWQMGYPLSQTLFTSYHIDSILWPEPVQLSEAKFEKSAMNSTTDPLLHKVFRSYCLGVVKSCDLVLHMVKSQHYYEEEDFATQLFNRELLHRFSTASVVELMTSSIDWIVSAQIEYNLQQTLLHHMRFRLELLRMLGSEFSELHPLLESATTQLMQLSRSKSPRKIVAGAFNARLQRQLASSVPPRPMITIEIQRALDFWRQSLKDTSNVRWVKRAENSIDLLLSYQLFNSQKPQPSLYVRALLQSFLGVKNMVCGKTQPGNFITGDLQNTSLTSSPLALLISTDEASRRSTDDLILAQLNGFLDKVERSYMNIFRTLCLNRCRTRRTLCHAALEWDQIQVEAEELDEELSSIVHEVPQMYGSRTDTTLSYPLSSWVYHHKLAQLRLIIQLGFELSIYAPHEICGMYWFLAYICETHLMHLERISHFVSIAMNVLPHPSECTTAQTRLRLQCQETVSTLYRIFSVLKATEAFARSLHRIYLLLARLKLIREQDVTYSSDRLRYEIRMRPFLHLSIPEPVEYSRYVHMCYLRDHNNERLLEQAMSFTRVAEKAWSEVSKDSWHVFPVEEEDLDEDDFIQHLWSVEVRRTLEAVSATYQTLDRLKQYVHETADEQHPSKTDINLPQQGDVGCKHPFWIVPSIK